MSDAAHDVDQSVLYQHAKRGQWGFAILAWETDERRGYQFEDGELRTFRRGFYELLKPVEPMPNDADERVERLQRSLGISQARKDAVSQAAKKGQQLVTLEDQQEIFRDQYPEGFADKKWISGFRGEEGKRTLKKHRDAVLAKAAEAFAEANLAGLIDAEDYAGVVTVAHELLRSTDLVRPADLKPLANFSDDQAKTYALALRGLLYGQDGFEVRFRRHASAAAPGATCSWHMATAPLALVMPAEHVCVRSSSFRKQAMWVAPNLEYKAAPSGQLYRQFLSMAQGVDARLRQAGHEPRDFLDIHDFIGVTLRPSAVKELTEKKAAAKAAAKSAQEN